MAKEVSAEKLVKDIRRNTRRKFTAEEKIRIVLEGLRGEESITALCRRAIAWYLRSRMCLSTFLTTTPRA